MTIHDELKALQQDLARSLKTQANAEQAAADANRAYEKALAEWEAQNPVLVQAKQLGADAKADSKKHVEELHQKVKDLLSHQMIDNLPEGFNQKRSKVVIYDKQGFIIQALQYFPHLLELNESAVQDFFANAAKEAPDGALILPENIRRFAAVEVIYQPKPEISDAKLSKLEFAEEAPAWEAPQNAIGSLTSAGLGEELELNAFERFAETMKLPDMPDTDKLPVIEDDFSSQDESLPISEAINPDAWDKDAAELEPIAPNLKKYGHVTVPPTEEINF